ncbi:NAD(P)-dependent malic enzyme [Geoglobus acetivorans]|uniref:NADP-dependent malic enzyme n=1 Tax=Geoglobus acetivorans TaxID=565033 RepID=A0A0A7GBQ1_GEOAI|nr:NADP-dependent malic enzyme [Geoglobus acetivorans]
MGDTGEMYRKAIEIHRKFHGKIETMIKIPFRGLEDFNYLYTPGVAKACEEIEANPDEAYELTWKSNSVAIVTDGSRTLGLGDIGSLASLPVMEGKALIFKLFGGVDAIPLPINEHDAGRFIEIVEKISPSFGGINLEDIESPKCFYILEKLKNRLDIPVWHDDQQGTATATLAGLFGALDVVGKKLEEVKIAVIGVGAANSATIRLLLRSGVPGENIVAVDSKGTIYDGREDLDAGNYKKWIAEKTNLNRVRGGIMEAMKNADVVIAASKPGPGVIKKEWIGLMNEDAIIFAEANPVPEILPEDAIEGGARIVGTGRGDYPNQINNSLVFPGVFRGVLTVRAREITDDMAIEAAKALYEHARPNLCEDYVIPRMDELEIHEKVAFRVARKAVKDGLARKEMNDSEIRNEIDRILKITEEKVRIISDFLSSL